ncbi:hypothetical protein [Entomobacter blattae]|uniref:Uncharacterized protein n=1 Tax=Entomobacter blattae TaxID=2762277 RepID=A0A7H1NUC2_9PROT|nr:hypothetical protein [Entomobacter blattae]QNT79382.1 hypothetical protein JGUZn3_21800 [Entomobacter blattae]
MNIWVIAYEIQDKEKLHTVLVELKNKFTACQIQNNVWLVQHPGDIHFMMGHFGFLIGKEDKLWISQVIHTFSNGNVHNEYGFVNPLDQALTWLNVYHPQQYFKT